MTPAELQYHVAATNLALLIAGTVAIWHPRAGWFLLLGATVVFQWISVYRFGW